MGALVRVGPDDDHGISLRSADHESSGPAGRARLNWARGKLLSSHTRCWAEQARRGRTSLDKPPATGWGSEETSEPHRTGLILALTRRKPPRTSGSHWPVAAPGSPAPGSSTAHARRW